MRDPVNDSVAGIIRNLLPIYCKLFPRPPDDYIWHPLDPFLQLEYALGECPEDLRIELVEACRMDPELKPDQSAIARRLTAEDVEKTRHGRKRILRKRL